MRYGPATLIVLIGLMAFASSAPLAGQSRQNVEQRPGKRSWGPEQATGAPDTPQAGDIQTAWASLQPDGGPEWLQVEFDRAVKIAEIRIRETFNPGAVNKVTAIAADGKEEVVWEGEDPTKTAPGDLVVKAQKDVTAGMVKIHLDSNKVPGWNEIDAVELVGADGSRQWASRASASSTYAEQPQAVRPNRVVYPGPGRPFPQLDGKQVVVHLEGGKTLDGVYAGMSGTLLAIESLDPHRTLIVNMQKVLYIEVAEDLGQR